MGVRGKTRGSALIYVLIALMVVAVFALGAQTLMLSYFKGEVRQQQEEQAYYSAKSACDVVAASLLENNTATKALFEQLAVGAKSDILDFSFGAEGFGEITDLSVTRTEAKKYTITATAAVADATRTVSLELRKTDGLFGVDGYNGIYAGVFEPQGDVTIQAGTNAQFGAVSGSGTVNGSYHVGSVNPEEATPAWANLAGKTILSSQEAQTFEGGAYYDDSINNFKNIGNWVDDPSITSANPVYFVITHNIEIDKPVPLDTSTGLPKVLFIVRAGGHFSIVTNGSAKDTAMVVFGESGSTITLKNCDFFGAITTLGTLKVESNVTFEFLDRESGGGGGTGAGGYTLVRYY